MLHSRFNPRLLRVVLAFAAGVALFAAASAEARCPLRVATPPVIDTDARDSLAFTQCGAPSAPDRCIELRASECDAAARRASATVDIWPWFETPPTGVRGVRAPTRRFDSGAPLDVRRTSAAADAVPRARATAT